MNNPFINLPDKKCYTKYNKNIFFSYPSNNLRSFQVGYLGIGPSSVSGSLHLRYPAKSPLYVSKINLTFTGVENHNLIIKGCEHIDELGNKLLDDSPISKSVTFFRRSLVIWEAPNMTNEASAINELDLRFNFALDDNLPASFRAACNFGGYDNGGIRYSIIAEIHTREAAATTSVQMEVLINRWSLPSEKLNEPIKMIRSNHKVTDENSLNSIDKIKHEALLHQSSYDMNSSIRIPVRLVLPKTLRLSIKEIIIKLEEHQKLKPGIDFPKHAVTREILRKRIKGDKFVSLLKDTGNLNTEYLFDVEIDVPSNEENMVNPKIENYYNISHRVFHKLKVKIKFGAFKELTLVGDIEIKNSFDRELIELGRSKGEIYPLNYVQNNINQR